MRFLIGQIMHETNTFSSLLTTEQSFREWEWAFAEQIIVNHTNVRSYIGGMLNAAEQLEI